MVPKVEGILTFWKKITEFHELTAAAIASTIDIVEVNRLQELSFKVCSNTN